VCLIGREIHSLSLVNQVWGCAVVLFDEELPYRLEGHGDYLDFSLT
jgi:hypothetical protein